MLLWLICEWLWMGLWENGHWSGTRNPVRIRWWVERRRPCSLVFGLAASRAKSPRWFESTWEGIFMILWLWLIDCEVLGLAQNIDVTVMNVICVCIVICDSKVKRLVDSYVYRYVDIFYGKITYTERCSFGDTLSATVTTVNPSDRTVTVRNVR
jgi:hypothetical protein